MKTTKSPRQKGRDGTLSKLNGAIERLKLSKESSDIASANDAFRSASDFLATIRDSGNERDYVEIGFTCASVCEVLDRGLKGREPDQISQPVLGAIRQLTSSVADMEREVIKQGKRSAVSRLVHSKSEKDKIAAWGRTLNTILQIFNTELLMNMVLSGPQGDADNRHQPVASSPLGELPPPPPRACFGRDGLIEKIVSLAENLTPIALIGAGGIGKTSVALNVLHHDRMKEKFGDDCRFIRCDEFAASRANLLNRLSKVLGAGAENPENLGPLRPFLSSKEILIVFDNAESILDPQGPNEQEIFGVVEELSRFKNICLCITSRITTMPPGCKRVNIPSLSVDAARSAFRQICEKGDRPDLIDDILRELDFHPLSITLLATVAHQNDWDNDRLAREWKRKQTGMLQTGRDRSLAAAIELSLASPMFQALGPDARELLGIVAFFPQGVDENNLDWLFPDIPDASTSFSTFCNLSLTYRSNGFFTMLAPLRDHLRPRDPKSSPFLCATRDRYFDRMSIEFDRNKPVFGESRWIVSEDANVEHLLDVLTSVDPNSADVWDACRNFMKHLYWHKRRLTTLGPKIEGLPDDHPAKPGCLHSLSRLFNSVGNNAEDGRLLGYALKLWRERGDESKVAEMLMELSDANRLQGHLKEGIQQAKEALEIYQRLGDAIQQAECLYSLAHVLYNDDQFEAAEGAAFQAIDLLPKKGEEFTVCKCHRLLGDIYRSKGEKEKSIHHLETALGIASAFNWHVQLFWVHHALAELFRDEDEFDQANTHVGQAKSHTANHTYDMGRAMQLQAQIWYRQGLLKEAMSEALLAIETYERLGVARGVEICRALLRYIEEEMEGMSVGSDTDDPPPRSPT